MINVIEAIEEKLRAQKDDIFFKDLQINELKNQLKKAEETISMLNAQIIKEDRNGEGATEWTQR